MADRWRLTDLVREALRNTFARGARLLAAVALVGVLGTASVAFLVLEQRAMVDQIDALTAQGRGVVHYAETSADRPTLIDRTSCEALATAPGVQSAGIVLDAGRADALPFAIDAPAQRVSSTLIPELGEVDVLLGATLADHAGPFRALLHGHPFEAAVAPGSREGTSTSFSLSLPLLPTDEAAGQCAVILEPLVVAGDVAVTHIAQLETRGNPLTAQEALSSPVDPVSAYLARMGRHLPLALGLLGGILTAVITRTRTSELAVYRLSGTSRTSLLTLLALEHLLVGGTAAAVTAVGALALTTQLLAPATAVVAGLTIAGATALTATIATIDIPFRRPTDLAKDR